jgi:hypothetical protein
MLANDPRDLPLVAQRSFPIDLSYNLPHIQLQLRHVSPWYFHYASSRASRKTPRNLLCVEEAKLVQIELGSPPISMASRRLASTTTQFVLFSIGRRAQLLGVRLDLGMRCSWTCTRLSRRGKCSSRGMVKRQSCCSARTIRPADLMVGVRSGVGTGDVRQDINGQTVEFPCFFHPPDVAPQIGTSVNQKGLEINHTPSRTPPPSQKAPCSQPWPRPFRHTTPVPNRA